ncbi:hypothetical protein OIU79_003378, partial [Salix purpurea]
MIILADEIACYISVELLISSGFLVLVMITIPFYTMKSAWLEIVFTSNHVP